MAIAFVNGAVGGNGTNVSTRAVTYSPTAGNTVCVFVTFSGAITNLTCTDNGARTLTPGPTITNGGVMASFYYTAPSGATTFTCNWTTARQVNMIVVEYSGAIGGVNPSLAGNTASANSALAQISVTTQDNNDFIVGGMAALAQAITVTVGTSRETEAVGAVQLQVADNTAALLGTVSLAGTLTGAQWLIAVLELRSTAPAAANTGLSQGIFNAGVNHLDEGISN